jgi:hypothetical protein
MPEIVSKHPDIVIQLLKNNGAKCNVGATQTILKNCPKEQFCALNNGEICVYGINDVKQMTQLSPADFAIMTSDVPTIYSSWGIGIAIIACLFGIVFGMRLKR